MALYPNGRYLTRSPGRHFGPSVGLEVYARGCGDRMNRFVSDTHARTASTPDGYDVHGAVPAIRAGSMAARKPLAAVDGSASLLNGGPMEGAAALCTVDSSAGLSLVVGLAGTASVLTVTGDGGTLSLTIGLDGTASMAFMGGAALSMIVPFEGTGSVASVTGAAALRGVLSMAGGWTPFNDLSPEGLAQAVLAALLAGPATPANVVQINSAGVAGTGQSGDMWRGE